MLRCNDWQQRAQVARCCASFKLARSAQSRHFVSGEQPGTDVQFDEFNVHYAVRRGVLTDLVFNAVVIRACAVGDDAMSFSANQSYKLARGSRLFRVFLYAGCERILQSTS